MEPNAVGKEAKLEALLASKPFDALTPDEKVFALEELGSEEQYHALWKMEQALKEEVPVDISPNPAIIRSLRYRMKQHAPRTGIAWVFGAKFPAYATVLLILLFSAASWWAGGSRSPLFVNARIDTVYLTKTDTFYRERIIYREAKTKIIGAPKQKVFKVAEAVSDEKPAPEVGVSMKEQQGLEVLLVSGSE
jgi:hypothetical protein